MTNKKDTFNLADFNGDLSTITDVWIGEPLSKAIHLTPDPEGNLVMSIHKDGTFELDLKEPDHAE